MNNVNVVGLSIATAVAALMALLGVVTVAIALRRRLGRLRVCAACEYPIDALPETTTRCPECGSDLTAPNAVATGRRRRDWLALVAGLALLLPAIVGIGLYATRVKAPAAVAVVAMGRPPVFVAPPSPPPPPYANLTDDQLADAILVEPTAPDRPAMLSEASRRTLALRTVASLAPAWTQRLLDAALAQQRDESKPFDVDWATFAESILADASSDKWHKYLHTGLKFDVKMRRTVHLGSPFPLSVTTRLRMSPAMARRLECRMTNLSLGPLAVAEVLRYDPYPADRFLIVQNQPAVLPLQFLRPADGKPPALPLGEQTATLSILVRTTHPTSDWIERVERPVTVLPARQINPQPPSDPAIDDAIGRRLRISPSATGPDGDGATWDGKTFRLALTMTDSPADVSAEVQVGYGTTGYGFGQAQWMKGESGTRTFELRYDPLKAAIGGPVVVDVIGSPLNADASFEEGDWWTGHVHYSNVTLLDTSAAATSRPTTPEASAYIHPSQRVPGGSREPYRPISP